MNLEEIRETYKERIATYDTLGQNFYDSISILLKDEGIKFLSISYRVKDIESFIEKIERKSYENPLTQIEDICGLRIICYYQKDIQRIRDTIKKEFEVLESTDKEDKLDYDQFGYRSYHIIASINPKWDVVPNYRGMTDLKCEIQIRTVLMHAWAEIEHNLAYKSKSQTPQKFRRKLHRISAKLEEADEQFEELKKESEEYQKEIRKEVKEQGDKFDANIELNVDSLQAYMDTNFPKRLKDIEATSDLVDQMNEFGVSLKDLNDGWNIIKPNFSELEKEFVKDKRFNKWAQVGIVRVVLDLTNDNFIKRHSYKSRMEERKRLKEKYTTL